MLVHKTCLGKIEPIPGIGQYCNHCDLRVEDGEIEDEGNLYRSEHPRS